MPNTPTTSTDKTKRGVTSNDRKDPSSMSNPQAGKDESLFSDGLIATHTQQKPVLILVGPEKHAYHIHKGLLAAKSPFFRAMFKECWDGEKEEVTLPSVSREGFEIIVHWIYTGRLPDIKKDYPHHGTKQSDIVFRACKAADILMMDKLQSELIMAEAAVLCARNLEWNSTRLKSLCDADLDHTKYYRFVLKSVVRRITRHAASSVSGETLAGEVKPVEDNDKVLADLMRGLAEWQQSPWLDFPRGNLSEFLVENDVDVLSEHDT